MVCLMPPPSLAGSAACRSSCSAAPSVIAAVTSAISSTKPPRLARLSEVEKLEVVDAAEVASVLDLEWDPTPPAVPRGARVVDEQVADQAADAFLARRKRRAHEVIGRERQERDLAAAIAQELVRVTVAPVLLNAASEAKVLDPGAAAVEEQIAEWAGLGESVERPAGPAGNRGQVRHDLLRRTWPERSGLGSRPAMPDR